MRTIQREIVGGYIFSKDGKILLGRNRKGGVYEGSFLVPAGGVEEGETREETLQREMLEEAGIDISESKIIPFRTSSGVNEKTLTDGERVVVEMTFYDYRIDLDKVADDVRVKTGSDWHNHRWFNADELKNIKLADPTREALINSGIIDAKTKVAPELTDGVLLLNGYKLSDVKDHLAGDDAEHQRWLNDFHESTEETVSRAIKRWQNDWRREGKRRTWAVREVDTNMLVGGVEFRLEENAVGNISYWIFPPYRGKGYAKRALSLMIDYGFVNLGIERFESHVDTENKASIATVKAVGFNEEKILKGEWNVAGEKRDAVILTRNKG